jgi:hypothetical protein
MRVGGSVQDTLRLAGRLRQRRSAGIPQRRGPEDQLGSSFGRKRLCITDCSNESRYLIATLTGSNP